MASPACKGVSAASSASCSSAAVMRSPLRARVPSSLPAIPSSFSAPAQRQQQQQRRQRGRLVVSASVPKTALSTYRFLHHPAAAHDWFQLAVRDIVKHVDRTPFLQLVQLGGGFTPKFTTLPVADSVVPVPELWQAIAEHESHGRPDAVILVQRVHPTNSGSAATSAAAAAAAAAAAGQATASGDYCDPPGSPRGNGASSSGGKQAQQWVESACRKLVQTGIADDLLTGKVGECCEGPHAAGHHHPQRQQQQQQQREGRAASAAPRPPTPTRGALVPAAAAAKQQQQVGSSSGIVPFLAAAPRRRAVQVAALGAQPTAAEPQQSEDCSRNACYYGVVVQSASGQTGVEGCYLLKTVRNVSPTGCACTHFSLTRVSQGDQLALEQQFIKSWLV